MKDTEYEFNERRNIEAQTNSGIVVAESFDVTIRISRIQYGRVEEMRKIIETFCRGEQK